MISFNLQMRERSSCHSIPSHQVPHLTVLVLFLLLQSACAHTKILSTWQEPGYHTDPGKVLVHAMARDPDVIAIFENEMVERFKKRGIDAIAGHRFLTDDIAVERGAITKVVKEQGIDTLFLAGPKSRKALESLRPGELSYGAAGYVSPDDNVGVFVSGLFYQPGTYAEDEVTWDMVIYDVREKKLVWSAVVKTYIWTNRVEEIRPALDKIMKRLLADKVLP